MEFEDVYNFIRMGHDFRLIETGRLEESLPLRG
jgi:hypothetical protein